MTFLLDVNVLVALGFQQHEFHARVAHWVKKESPVHFATCAITELGFVRVLVQAPSYGLTVNQARVLLAQLKASDFLRWDFISDNRDISYLPAWVKSAAQITDGHLAELAKANGAMLATLDRKIPGVFLIPEN
ncbi:MAG TPA: PIN domain-containing protein [Candidatus Angelobacter sp.]